MAREALNPRKWFDRFQPQTLQIATWLLYLNGLFAFVGLLDESDWIGYARATKGGLGFVVGVAVVSAYVLGGFLMANDRRIGWRLALVGAFSPFVLRFWILSDFPNIGLWDKITGNNTISFIFDVALCALLLHPQSREHQRIWYR
ncbi:MAG: hypothetical protein ACKOD2_09830 [Ilumatobacteraceae bacterium]